MKRIEAGVMAAIGGFAALRRIIDMTAERERLLLRARACGIPQDKIDAADSRAKQRALVNMHTRYLPALQDELSELVADEVLRS